MKKHTILNPTYQISDANYWLRGKLYIYTNPELPFQDLSNIFSIPLQTDSNLWLDYETFALNSNKLSMFSIRLTWFFCWQDFDIGWRGFSYWVAFQASWWVSQIIWYTFDLKWRGVHQLKSKSCQLKWKYAKSSENHTSLSDKHANMKNLSNIIERLDKLFNFGIICC
jgi:hypothetical protein